ncbi:hypothetical protein [Oleiharenicola lentus]|uniref:hypothetical protein n=1 Tax=Oleiharenicola lentus TaxID=2508720 RepID=UPI003F67857E
MEFVSRGPQEGEAVVDYSLLGGEHVERGKRLYLTGLALLGVALAYLGYTANVRDILHLCQGLVIITLSVLPALFWAKTGGSRFPVFEPVMLLCANAYGMPMLNASEQLAEYASEVISLAGWTVIAYQTVGIVVYQTTRGIPKRTPFWRDAIITSQLEKLVVYGMFLSTIYLWMDTFLPGTIPRELNSACRAVFYGISILCTFVSTQRWGRGEMKPQEKTILIINLVPQLLFMSVGLVLIGAISTIGIGLLGYLSGSKRVPWVVIIFIFTIIAILHTGKTKMRAIHWDQKIPGPSSVTELPAFYTQWFEYGMQPSGENKTASRKLLERSSLMHILCLVATYTPDRQDYLYGKTYAYVPPQLVPRLLWPDKPRSHIATYELAKYYGLQSEEDTEATTIAFGLLAEAYANFGIIGAILLGATWGFMLKKLQIWSTFSPMFSFAGLFMVLMTAWSFSAELTMAAWVSSLEQAVIVVLGVPMIIRALFGL